MNTPMVPSETTRTRIGGDYEVLAELGKGGMAEVFKARHRRLGRTVALKVLPSHLLIDEEAHARFEREARAGAHLDHDNIVTTYDIGIHDGRPYLAVAFIEGETLAARLRREGRLTPEETVRLIAPIAEALAYAHRKGVIHRDITSSNIMIRAEDERPILIDFGIAQASFTHRLTRRGDALGTPAYMSPEQARAQDLDARSDLYSLGVVLYECLTGTLPFQSPNTEVLLANIKYEAHRPVRALVPTTPPALSAVVDRCLRKQPDERFDDGDALAEALRAGLIVAPDRKRRPVIRWMLGLLLLAALAYGAVRFRPAWLDALGIQVQPAPTTEEEVQDTQPDETEATLPEPEPPLETLVARATAAYAAQNYGNAFTLFRQAAERGSAEAQYRLGTMYRNGEGVAADEDEAVTWYRRAAAKGYAEAEQALTPTTTNENATPTPDTSAVEKPPSAPDAEEDVPDVYFRVEQMPELIGGLAALQEALRYPEMARRAGVTGSVIVRFVVDEKGAVIDPKVERGIGFGCDQEALRVVREARFRPGRHLGMPVKVRRSLTITFQ